MSGFFVSVASVIVVIAVQDGSVADPRFQQAISGAAAIYRDCVAEAVPRLELSGEPATTVADAAISSCAEDRYRLLEIMALSAMINNDLSAREAASTADEVAQMLDAELRAQAVLVVTTSRAARAAPDE